MYVDLVVKLVNIQKKKGVEMSYWLIPILTIVFVSTISFIFGRLSYKNQMDVAHPTASIPEEDNEYDKSEILKLLDRLKSYIDSDFDGKISKDSWIAEEINKTIKRLRCKDYKICDSVWNCNFKDLDKGCKYAGGCVHKK